MKGALLLTNFNEIGIPGDLLDKMEVIDVFINSENSNSGLLLMGNDLYPNSNKSIIRLFLLQLLDGEYIVKEELQAFQFNNYDNALSFIKRLPEISALEFLIGIHQSSLDCNTTSPLH